MTKIICHPRLYIHIPEIRLISRDILGYVHNVLINFHDWNHSDHWHFNNHLIFYRNFDVLLLRIRQVSFFYPQQEHCVRKIALRRHVKNAGLILLRRDNLVLMGMVGPSWERQGWTWLIIN